MAWDVTGWADDWHGFADIVFAAMLVALTTLALVRDALHRMPALRVRGFLRGHPFDSRLGSGSLNVRIANEGNVDGEVDYQRTDLFVRTRERGEGIKRRWAMRPRRLRDWIRPWAKWKSAGIEVYNRDYFDATHPLQNPGGYRGDRGNARAPPSRRDEGLVVFAHRTQEFVFVFKDSSVWNQESVLVIRAVSGRGHKWHVASRQS
jgi:hypothetical protein